MDSIEYDFNGTVQRLPDCAEGRMVMMSDILSSSDDLVIRSVKKNGVTHMVFGIKMTSQYGQSFILEPTKATVKDNGNFSFEFIIFNP